MRTLDEIIRDPKASWDEIRSAFNAHLRAKEIDIHNWDIMIPEIVNYIEIAAKFGNLNVIKYLQNRFLSERPVLLSRAHETHDRYDLSNAFVIAATEGHVEVLKLLYNESKLNHVHVDKIVSGTTALFKAAEKNKIDAVKYLVSIDAKCHLLNAYNFAFSTNNTELMILLNSRLIELAEQNKKAKQHSGLEEKYSDSSKPSLLIENVIDQLKQIENITSMNFVDQAKNAINMLNDPNDVMRLHSVIKKMICNIPIEIHADLLALLTKIAKQRILEIELDHLLTNRALPHSSKIAVFLNTNRFQFGNFYSDNWYKSSVISTQSKEIYDLMHHDIAYAPTEVTELFLEVKERILVEEALLQKAYDAFFTKLTLFNLDHPTPQTPAVRM